MAVVLIRSALVQSGENTASSANHTSAGSADRTSISKPAHRATPTKKESSSDHRVHETVRKALESETRGDNASRATDLKAALDESGDVAAVRWAAGYVRRGDRWASYEKLMEITAGEASLSEYYRIRGQYPDTAEGNLRLADWCRRHNLPEQEQAHLLRVLAFNPNQPSVMQRLGMVQVGGAWLRPRELQEAAARAKQASLDLKHWAPRLEKLRSAFLNGSGAARERAARLVRAIHDPGAIPAMELVLSSADEDAALAVIAAVSQMRAPQAAVSLARHALFSDSQDVIDEAIERLKQCPEDSFVPTLLASLATPLAVQTAAIPGPGGRLIFRQAFYSEDQNSRHLTVLDDATLITGASAGNAEGTLAAINQAEGEASAKATRRAVVAAAQSELTSALNKRICDVLRETTGQALPDEPRYWWYWWNDHNEVYQQSSKPYQMAYACEFSTAAVQSPTAPLLSKVDNASIGVVSIGARYYECLVAGTPIWTDRGAVAIEQVQIGDRVLAQDPTSGELVYQPVVRTTVRPKGPVIEIRLENETLRASGGHPFWVDGRGWVRARNLEPGMLLHQVRGAVRVNEVKPLDDEQETYNLIVDEFHDYFAGASLVLTHDNTVRQPTSTAVPGLPLEVASRKE